jgi:hypothetical protein
MTMTATIEQRNAYHESGHVVAAVTCGIKLIRVTITAEIPHVCRRAYDGWPEMAVEALIDDVLKRPRG